MSRAPLSRRVPDRQRRLSAPAAQSTRPPTCLGRARPPSTSRRPRRPRGSRSGAPPLANALSIARRRAEISASGDRRSIAAAVANAAASAAPATASVDAALDDTGGRCAAACPRYGQRCCRLDAGDQLRRTHGSPCRQPRRHTGAAVTVVAVGRPAEVDAAVAGTIEVHAADSASAVLGADQRPIRRKRGYRSLAAVRHSRAIPPPSIRRSTDPPSAAHRGRIRRCPRSNPIRATPMCSCCRRRTGDSSSFVTLGAQVAPALARGAASSIGNLR